MTLLLSLKTRTHDFLFDVDEVIPILQTEIGSRLFFPDKKMIALYTLNHSRIKRAGVI